MKKFILGFISCICIVVLCSYTSFKVSYTDFGVRTVFEDGHKYVVAYSSYDGGATGSSISICHSAACQCLKNKNK